MLLGSHKNGLYYFEDICLLDIVPVVLTPKHTLLPIANTVTCNKALEKAKLWHIRLVHVPFNHLKAYKHDLDSNTLLKSFFCTIFLKAKQFRLPFKSSYDKFTSPFELLHMDVWGPYSVCTSNGCKCFLTIVDDYTRCTLLYFLQRKSQCVSYVPQFFDYVETQHNARIKVVCSDNALELCEGAMKQFYTLKGIKHQKSCVDTPQQNGIVERKHRHLLETARALFFQAQLPPHF